MIAIETNILVYAHRQDAPDHERSLACMQRLMDSATPWAIPWPCVHEFLSTVTKPIFRPATTVSIAFDAIQLFLAHHNAHVIGETDNHLSVLQQICKRGNVTGGAIHDARIAAICLGNGITALWSADRDFSRFPDLNVVNPLVA